MKYNEFDNPREKPQVRPVTTMDPKEFDDRIEKAKAKAYKKPEGPDLSKLWNKEKPATEDGMTSADVDRVKNQHFTDKQIKHAYRVLNHPSVKGGNYTAAYNIINRIAPGLADHPDVANALKRANEGFIGKKTEYNDFLQNKLDTAIQEYDTPEKKAERDALMQKYLNKGGKIEKVPTGKTAYKGKELKPAYKKDTAGTPITSPMSDESVEEDINEKGRVVLEKAGFDPNAIHEYMAVFNDHGDTSELEDMNRNKIGVADAMAMVLASHDVQNESVEESSIKPYVSMYKGDDGKTVYDVLDKDGKSAYKTKDERLAQHYFKKNYQKLKEDGPPFGSGMELLRMAIMRKFITVQEWDLLKHKWNDAADEVEQKYADWPEGEGFGSSDHNFAIRDLMTAVGYEFDDQDTSGRFVVTKQPEEIEKAGITNARMSKDARIDRAIEKQKADAETNPNWGKDIGPVATEGGMPASIIKHKQKLAHMSDEELADRFKDFDEQRLRQMAWRHGYGKMSSHYLDRVRNHMTSKRTGTTEAKQEGFAVRYLDPKNGKRFAVAFKTKVDATKKAAQLKSVGVKDISITQHNLNFKEAKKDLTYESKLANMLNQRLK